MKTRCPFIFLQHEWFLQNLGKDFIRTNLNCKRHFFFRREAGMCRICYSGKRFLLIIIFHFYNFVTATRTHIIYMRKIFSRVPLKKLKKTFLNDKIYSYTKKWHLALSNSTKLMFWSVLTFKN